MFISKESTHQEGEQDYNWHPFTPHYRRKEVVKVVRAQGSYLFTDSGQKIFDGISSWWVNLHGHCHPRLMAALNDQAQVLDHVLFAGLTHDPALQLGSLLMEVTRHQFAKAFYSDNGSTAVEVALKLAMQYWSNKGISTRQKIVAFDDSYHGDTFGAMSVGARNTFNRPFWPYLFPVEKVMPPVRGRGAQSVEQFKQLLHHHRGQLAAFIFEPLVQGTAGMVMQDSWALDKMVSLAKDEGIITIADEVMTGLGRTGKLFACDYLSQYPDLMCLSKGITGGVMPLGVTLVTKEVFSAYASDDVEKTFFHGHSYTANPLSCRLAHTSLELLKEPRCLQQIQMISNSHLRFLADLNAERKLRENKLRDARSLGTIMALELKTPSETGYFNSVRDNIYSYFWERGTLLRPLGNIVYMIPPYCSSATDLQTIYQQLFCFLEEV